MAGESTFEQLKRCCGLLRKIARREVPRAAAVRVCFCRQGREQWWEGTIQRGQTHWMMEAATLDALESKRLRPRLEEVSGNA